MCDICQHYPCVPFCPNAPPPKIHGYCKQCYEPLYDNYDYYIDKEGNKFCCEECAEKYNEIKEMEWTEDDE